ncbi:MAGE protein [Purpureocillium lavendulum]|uniref:MAGE protein n=1 Tax=Purpureocillium lavendulum TaxID=1247861 RepID=A0AB34FXD0_9HYPO|nr:MAGE protein [Purpureocillium lavendulum]
MPPGQRRRRPADEDDADEDSRPRQRQNRDVSEDDADDDSGDAMDADGDRAQSADNQLAKKLVRYALSCEYSRTVIRRDGIKERVLGNQGRAFKRIFALAQKQLRSIWGMELRELPVREKMSLQEKRQGVIYLPELVQVRSNTLPAMKSNSQLKTGSGAYILCSTLPDAYRSAAILKPSKTPSADDEATYAAFYTVVVSLIWLNAGELSEQKLKRYLLRLNADQNVSNEKTEDTLKKLERQGYLVKKVERPPVGQDGDHTITWHVGPRGKEEVALDGVMGTVREVYADWDPDMEKKLRASLGLKAKTTTSREAGDEAAAESGGND